MVGISILKQENTNFEAKVTPGSEKDSGGLIVEPEGGPICKGGTPTCIREALTGIRNV